MWLIAWLPRWIKYELHVLCYGFPVWLMFSPVLPLVCLGVVQLVSDTPADPQWDATLISVVVPAELATFWCMYHVAARIVDMPSPLDTMLDDLPTNIRQSDASAPEVFTCYSGRDTYWLELKKTRVVTMDGTETWYATGEVAEFPNQSLYHTEYGASGLPAQTTLTIGGEQEYVDVVIADDAVPPQQLVTVLLDLARFNYVYELFYDADDTLLRNFFRRSMREGSIALEMAGRERLAVSWRNARDCLSELWLGMLQFVAAHNDRAAEAFEGIPENVIGDLIVSESPYRFTTVELLDALKAAGLVYMVGAMRRRQRRLNITLQRQLTRLGELATQPVMHALPDLRDGVAATLTGVHIQLTTTPGSVASNVPPPRTRRIQLHTDAGVEPTDEA